MLLLEREIRSQATVLVDRPDAAQAALLVRDIDYLVIAARGSSDNAARYAQYLLGLRARLPVGLATPWLYSRAEPPLLRGGAVMAISQSGRSPDVAGVIAAARAQGRPTIVLTNEPSSPLAALADVVVPLRAGEERSVAATKTYLASLHAVAHIAEVEPLPGLPSVVEAVARSQLAERARFDALADASLITACGRGPHPRLRARPRIRDRMRDGAEAPRAVGHPGRGPLATRPDAWPGRGP